MLAHVVMLATLATTPANGPNTEGATDADGDAVELVFDAVPEASIVRAHVMERLAVERPSLVRLTGAQGHVVTTVASISKPQPGYRISVEVDSYGAPLTSIVRQCLLCTETELVDQTLASIYAASDAAADRMTSPVTSKADVSGAEDPSRLDPAVGPSSKAAEPDGTTARGTLGPEGPEYVSGHGLESDAPRSRRLVVAGGTLLGLGVVTATVGGVLIHKGAIRDNDEPRYLYSTREAGIAATSGGLLFAAVGTALTVVGAVRLRADDDASWKVSSNGRGVAVSGRF